MKKFFVSILILIIMLMPAAALADSEVAPHSYKKLAASNKFVFVMIYPGSPEVKTENGKTYTKSGLYTNDNSTEPLWTIDGYSHEVFISSDGNYAARLGPWPKLGWGNSRDLNQLVLAFYNRGKLTQEYYIKDLVVSPGKLQKSVSHFQFNKNIEFKEADNTVSLETYDGSFYEFDMVTGDILSAQRGVNAFMAGLYCAILIAMLFLVLNAIRKNYR